MKRNRLLIICLSISFFVSILTSSCTSGLNDRQKLFLDYAKLEDKYHGTGYYHNFDLYDVNTKAPVYMDSAFNIARFKTKLLKNFKLIDNGGEFTADFGGLELQYPHQLVMIKNENGTVSTKLSVFVPDKYYKFSVDKDDLGKSIMKDSVEVTLLDMTNDGATLMIENKGMRQSYDYTYDNVDKKDFSEKEKYKEPKLPGYHNYLFIGEQVDSPNMPTTSNKDNLIKKDFSRLAITLSNEKGKTLESKGDINDFRHYLWYRNNDMPYPELTANYADIKQKYKELDEDTLHKFHPIYIVTLRASGKVGKVDFFLRSDKGHIETIDIGDVITQKKENQSTVIPQNEILPIANITKDNMGKLLKINCTTVSGKLNEPDQILIYASLPHSYNARSMSISFSDIKLIGDAKDTTAVNESEDGDDYFDVGYNNQGSNLSAIKFSPNQQIAKKVVGKIAVDVAYYYDKTFTLHNLPKWIKIDKDGTTLSFYNNEPALLTLVEFLVFGKGSATIPMDILVQKYDDATKLLTNKYATKVNQITIRFKKTDSGLSEEIPFELDIPQAKKEDKN
ncbi:hypothetical protein ACUN24_18600 [Pedobacter sp. WC2501]|uniref:hypothetical protein n=1 Tax=Pedobacter sp. WC2501 TaxID=3461400 RepID=UPI0040458277